MRPAISVRGCLPGRWVVVAVLVVAVSMVMGIVATKLAGAHAVRRMPADPYEVSLRVPGRLLVGSGSENPMAVDRHGITYVFVATRTQQGSIPSADAPDVEELSPAGKKIRSFSTTFRVHGQKLYVQANGLAVTPNGAEVFVVGNYSQSLSGDADSRPFLAKYSAASGAFLRGYNFDTNGERLGAGVAVDPSGEHVYVGDERNPFTGPTTARIYEFAVSHLDKLRRFRLAGNDLCCDLAVAPDGHLFAQVGPKNSTQVLVQEYGPTGGYKGQFISPPGGLAIGPTGDIFAGSRAKQRIDRLSSAGKLLETLGTGAFTGFPVAAAVDTSGDVYAFDEAKNDVSTIVKFVPTVPQTRISAHPPSTMRSPTATFKFDSSVRGAKLECRLRKAGAGTPAFKSCSSPKSYHGLSNGSYTFQATSVSPAGPVDRTPASFHFRVNLS